MNDVIIGKVINRLRKKVTDFKEPIVTQVARTKNPYLVLISTLISLRTKDEVTALASERVFALAKSPKKMISLSPTQIEKAIYPAGFYKTKARTILRVSKILLDDYDGKVPDTVEELVKMKGVGRKTANLVVTHGYGKLGICVDTHVHRISNRLGYVSTKTPDQTEYALREKLPKKYWIEYNDLLVAYGQNLCTPLSPWCSKCVIEQFCPRVGVDKNR